MTVSVHKPYKGIHNTIAGNIHYYQQLHKKLEQRKAHQESVSLRNELKKKFKKEKV